MRVARSMALLAVLVFTSAAAATPNERAGDASTIVPAPAFAPVDLVPPAGADWATNGGDYGQTRYSSLREVSKANG